MEEIMKELMQDKRVRKAMAYLQEDQEQMMEDLLELVQIPAFSNHERKKAEAMRDKFTALGLQDVHMDEVDNVFGRLPGAGEGPKIMMAAHTDTVFPLDTPLVPQQKDGIWYAPGINDDTHGLADLLTMIRAIKASGLVFAGDVVFVPMWERKVWGICVVSSISFGSPMIFQHLFLSIRRPWAGSCIARQAVPVTV